MNASSDHMLLFLETRVELCTVKNVCVQRVVHRWGVRCDEIVSGILISRHSTCIFLKFVTTNLLWLLIHLQPPLLLPSVYTTQPVVSSNMMWRVQEDMKDSNLFNSVNLASCRVPAPIVSKKPIHQGFSQIPTWWESLSILSFSLHVCITANGIPGPPIGHEDVSQTIPLEIWLTTFNFSFRGLGKCVRYGVIELCQNSPAGVANFGCFLCLIRDSSVQ